MATCHGQWIRGNKYSKGYILVHPSFASYHVPNSSNFIHDVSECINITTVYISEIRLLLIVEQIGSFPPFTDIQSVVLIISLIT